MNFLKIHMVIGFLLSGLAHADGYYGRFWRGEEQKNFGKYVLFCDEAAPDCFEYFVNQWLIPATPSYAARDALVGYAPVLLPRALKEKYQDEFALILYSDQNAYACLRGRSSCTNPLPEKTAEDRLIKKEGLVYGPIHGEIFDMTTVDGHEPNGRAIKRSRSLVPVPFSGKIELQGAMHEVSYDLLDERADIPVLNGKFVIRERKKSVSVRDYLASLESQLQNLKERTPKQLKAYYILITEDYYSAYIFYKAELNTQQWLMHEAKLDQTTLQTFETKLKKLVPQESTPLVYDFIEPGEGGNLLFTPGEKPGTSDHPLLPKNP